jgi:hypothetical protein
MQNCRFGVMDMKSINKYTDVDYMNIDTAQEINQENESWKKKKAQL